MDFNEEELLITIFMAYWALSNEGIGLNYSGIAPTPDQDRLFIDAGDKGARIWLNRMESESEPSSSDTYMMDFVRKHLQSVETDA